MLKSIKLCILLFSLIGAEKVCAQFELKSQVNFGLYKPNKNKVIQIYGLDFSGHYVFDNSVSFGIYGAGNKVNSTFDIHRIFAVGGELSWSTFQYWQVNPLINVRLGYCTERSKGEYSNGSPFDRRLEGINSAFNIGLKTNIEKLNHFQFGLTAGIVSYKLNPFKIFGSGGPTFIQYGIQCIYSFESKKQSEYY